MVSYTFRMPSGVPGVVSRDQHSTIQPELMLASNPVTTFGVPCIRDAATSRIRAPIAGDTSSMIAGLLVKPYPTQAAYGSNQGLYVATPNPIMIQDLMVRGYIAAVCNGTQAPSKDGPVFLRIATPGAGKPIGGIEAAADGTNTIQVPNCVFMGPPDAQGNVELRYNI